VERAGARGPGSVGARTPVWLGREARRPLRFGLLALAQVLSLRTGAILPEPAEGPAQPVELGLVDPRREVAVERDHRPPQRLEERLARVGQLDAHGAAVARTADATHEPGLLQTVEMARERGALDADRVRELVLRAPLVRLQRAEDEPDRDRAAGLGETVVEGAADGLRRHGQLEPDGGLRRLHSYPNRSYANIAGMNRYQLF